jgi:hypothetical protein
MAILCGAAKNSLRGTLSIFHKCASHILEVASNSSYSLKQFKNYYTVYLQNILGKADLQPTKFKILAVSSYQIQFH